MGTNRIKDLRKEKGLTLNQLSEKTGISASHLSRIEAGARGLKLEYIESISRVLSVTPTELIAGQEFGYESDLLPYTPPKGTALEKAIASEPSQKMFRVLSDVLNELGIQDGDVVIANMAKSALQNLTIGQPVVVAMPSKVKDRQPLLLRQYITPNMLVTNSVSQNALPIHIVRSGAKIIGLVMI